MSHASPSTTPASSQYLTPDQTPRRSSPLFIPPERTQRQFIDSDLSAYEPFHSIAPDDGLVGSIRTLLDRYLAEYRRANEIAEERLRDQRDLALSQCDEQRNRADTIEEELQSEIAAKRRLAERLSTIETFVDEESLRRSEMEDLIEQRDRQLSDAATQYAERENILDSTLILLDRKENENNEIREQLNLNSRQIEEANSIITEERANSDRYLLELDAVKIQLGETQFQASAIEIRLNEQTNELVQTRDELLRRTARNSELESELTQVRSEVELLDTMRSERIELETRGARLSAQVDELLQVRLSHEGKIDDLEEPERTLRCQVGHLTRELHQEQRQNSDLETRTSDQLRELNALNTQNCQLRTNNGDLTNANATLRRANIGMRLRIVALKCHSGALNTELVKLRSKMEQISRIQATLPPFPAVIRYKNSASNLAFVQKRPVAIRCLPGS